jgi:hypothetical protein
METQDLSTERPQLKSLHHVIPSWLTKIGGSAIVLLVLLSVALVGGIGYILYRQEQREQNRDQRMNMFLSYVQILNEQYAVREYLEMRIGDRQSPEVKSQMAVELIEGCKRGNIPFHLALAIPGVESTWQSNPRPTVAGAGVGYWQVMPNTAISYFKRRGWTFTMEALQDPVKNTAIALDILQDYHEASVISGQSNAEDWVIALWNYNGKGETYARKVLAASVEPKNFIETYRPKATEPAPTSPAPAPAEEKPLVKEQPKSAKKR